MGNLFDNNQGKFDPINSTYRHQIRLTNGKILTGYSKGLNVPELSDKDTLFQRVNMRLYRNGYGHEKSLNTPRETICIDFFLNQSVDDEWIATVYPNDYKVNLDWSGSELAISFLKRFTEQKRSGKERKNLIKEPRQRDILSLNLQFNTVEALLEYTLKLKNQYGIPHGRVNQFYADYIRKHFPNK